MKSTVRTITLCVAILGGVASIQAESLSLSSPDGRKTVRFEKPGKELT